LRRSPGDVVHRPDVRPRAVRRRSISGTAPEDAPSIEQEKGKRPLRFLREIPVLILIAFVLALLIKAFVIQAFYIPSGSMESTLQIGDRVLVEKVLTHPHRGWIVVFRNPFPASSPRRDWLHAFGPWILQGFGISTSPDEDSI